MKVAFATQDSVHINAHFGWAKKMDIYEVSTEEYSFLKTVEFWDELKEDGNEDKLLPKMKAVTGCAIVYVSAIGSSAAARLLKEGITPLKVENEHNEITNVLNALLPTLGNPPPWLRKTLRSQVNHFDWEEEKVFSS